MAQFFEAPTIETFSRLIEAKQAPWQASEERLEALTQDDVMALLSEEPDTP